VDTPVDTAVENPVDNSGDIQTLIADPCGIFADSLRSVVALHGDTGTK
jgi:hypothetical protein